MRSGFGILPLNFRTAIIRNCLAFMISSTSNRFNLTPKAIIHCSADHRFSKMDIDLRDKDVTQVKLMEEECILVDENDKVIGTASKKICHLMENINKGMLHRAFSVFLFNSKRELLLQQRSLAKITYPDHWTNTCCSHPLNSDLELDEADAIGVKRAAQRKLSQELGIKPEEMPLHAFHFLTRIHYKSENVPRDETWGEHEVDYILVALRDVEVEPNQNEVKAIKYVNQEQLRQMIGPSEKTILITPWFRMIANNFLKDWWDNLSSLTKYEDHTSIHRLTE